MMMGKQKKMDGWMGRKDFRRSSNKNSLITLTVSQNPNDATFCYYFHEIKCINC